MFAGIKESLSSSTGTGFGCKPVTKLRIAVWLSCHGAPSSCDGCKLGDTFI